MSKNNNENKQINEFITYREAMVFCSECDKACSDHCEVWKNAKQRLSDSMSREIEGGK